MLAFLTSILLWKKFQVPNASRKCRTLAMCGPKRPSVVFITPRGFCRDAEHAMKLTRGALTGGASLVQIRDIDASEEKRLQIAHRLVKEFKDPRLFVMNGPLSLKVTQAIPGFGMHLREKDRDLFLSKALELVANYAFVGCSVHSCRSAMDAMKHGPISYLQVGTMFETHSHPGKKPEGTRLLADIRNALDDDCSLIGVGGIDASNAEQVFQSGAHGVAVISAIASAPNPAEATRKIVQIAQRVYNA